MKKINGIRKVCGILNRNQSLYFRVFYDKEKSAVWADAYEAALPQIPPYQQHRLVIMELEPVMLVGNRHISMADIAEAIRLATLPVDEKKVMIV
jgi:hypothetical protein